MILLSGNRLSKEGQNRERKDMSKSHLLAGVLLIACMIFSGCAAHRNKLACTSPELPFDHGGLKVAKADATIVCADDLYEPDICPAFFRIVIENPTKKELPIDFSGFRLVLENGTELTPDVLPGSKEPGVVFNERLRRIVFRQVGLDREYMTVAEDVRGIEKDEIKIDSMVSGIAMLIPGCHCVLKIGFYLGEEIERCTLIVTLGREKKKLELKWSPAEG